MRKRLYFLLSDFQGARQLLDEMLLARVDVGHVHFLAKRDTLPADLPGASVLQKTDVMHGTGIGLITGGSVGIVCGGLLVMMPPGDISLELVTVLITGLLGAGFGAWISGMIGTQVANSKLRAFHADIDGGKTLMMVDVPRTRVAAIRELVTQRHPEAVFGGIDPTIPAFP
jgi:membrane protein DedA with SNARE-associated domain